MPDNYKNREGQEAEFGQLPCETCEHNDTHFLSEPCISCVNSIMYEEGGE